MKTKAGALTGCLYQLARLYSVQTAYYDMARQRRQASMEGLLAVLRALGAPLTSLDGAASALRERRQALRQRVLEPVITAWDGECPAIRVCVPASLADASWRGCLEMEDKQRQEWQWRAADLPVLDSAEVEGRRYLVRAITLPVKLPWGYHRFSLEMPGGIAEALIIAAPPEAYLPPGAATERIWGAFLPLYALRTRHSGGSGDYTSLGDLADWVAGMGGDVVATLPLLPTFLDEPFAPSPYAPVSRLVWSDFYVDTGRVPEPAACPPVGGGEGDLNLVDYRRIMALKRRVLEEGCRDLLRGKGERYRDFQDFLRANPVVADYARFRAVMERQSAPWPSWPQPLRGGALQEGDYDEGAAHYHMYAQWLAHQQVQSLAEKCRSRGTALYFDLPLGVHPDGYDVWRERGIFCLDMSTGAPPDAVFTSGQDWGMPPLHPEKIREQGYRYVIGYLRHHLRPAGMLRIDHVMGLHRLFWVPGGMAAGHGIYVRYHAGELYAILALESHRHRSIIVGEDLGTVPAFVRPAMSRHAVQRLYVLHYELADDASGKLHQTQHDIVASLNTHDMPPFTAFWQGLDIAEKLALGLLDRKGARAEKQARRAIRETLVAFLRKEGWLRGRGAGVRGVFRACLAFLSTSRARVVLVNLEDLWRETASQNVPGSGDKRPNWRRRARYALEEFCRLPEVRDNLEEIDRLRKHGVK